MHAGLYALVLIITVDFDFDIELLNVKGLFLSIMGGEVTQ